WQGVETYITQRGKSKLALEGIPTEAFWRLWKSNKAAIRATGLCLSYEIETVPAGRTTATGLQSRAGGGYKQGTRKRKSWTARIFLNDSNRGLIASRWEIPSETAFCESPF
ncbi:hypothetical protein RZS08_09605, partial [Arthrospira platensis SPKY1]|nr:hypothetical protein [Arthrospira platensis SPKY1]